MVFTMRASALSRAAVRSKNLSATSAASSSPCASVSAVYPARSANTTARCPVGNAASRLLTVNGWSAYDTAARGDTSKLNIMPLWLCSAI